MSNGLLRKNKTNSQQLKQLIKEVKVAQKEQQDREAELRAEIEAEIRAEYETKTTYTPNINEQVVGMLFATEDKDNLILKFNKEALIRNFTAVTNYELQEELKDKYFKELVDSLTQPSTDPDSKYTIWENFLEQLYTVAIYDGYGIEKEEETNNEEEQAIINSLTSEILSGVATKDSIKEAEQKLSGLMKKDEDDLITEWD